MAQNKTRATFRNFVMPNKAETSLTLSGAKLQPETSEVSSVRAGLAFPAETTTGAIRHVYVHIPFCARICPYCAFYKELLDRSQTQRFCDAILRELELHARERSASGPSRTGTGPVARDQLRPVTIYFGGGTPTALTTAQLDYLLTGFRRSLDLSELIEWTVEANPGSVSPKKAERLHELGISRISLGVQSWDDDLLKLLGREHNAKQAKESFQIL